MAKITIQTSLTKEEICKRLKDNIIEANGKQKRIKHSEGVFMGNVGAKKFYVFYKPPFTRTVFPTMLSGEIKEDSENQVRVNAHFEKPTIPLIFISIISLIMLLASIIVIVNGVMAKGLALENCALIGVTLVMIVVIYICFFSISENSKVQLTKFLKDILEEK